MTASGQGAPDRGRTTALDPRRGAVGGIVGVLVLGLAFRLILAYLLPGSGFRQDLDAFRFWATDLAANGLGGFYARPFFHDYTPGYLYVLAAVGHLGRLLGGVGDLIKLPPILADVALGAVVYAMLGDLRVGQGRRLAAAAIVLANPIGWFDSVVWGQVDSFGVVFLLIAVRELWRGRTERAAVLAVVAALIKPQLGILVPLVAAVTIRKAIWPPATDHDAWSRLGIAWERRTRGPLRILTTGLAGLLTAVVLAFPFGLSVVEPDDAFPYVDSGLVRQIVSTAAGYPYLTVNAYNPWALLEADGSGLAANGAWICDALLPADLAPSPDVPCVATDPPPAVGTVLGVPAVLVGSAGLLAVILATSVLVARRPDPLTILVGLAILALAFFVVPTRVHERYLFPLFAIGAMLAAVSGRWALAYVAVSVATFANMYVVLTTIYPGNPGIADWLGIGPAIRSPAGVTIVALAHLVVFGWAIVQLRASAMRRLADEVDGVGLEAAQRRAVTGGEDMPSVVPAPALRPAGVGRPDLGTVRVRAPTSAVPVPDRLAGPVAAASRLVPAWYPRATFDRRGPLDWLRVRMAERPLRPDRTRLLHHEGGGRFDRLDVWILVVLVVATMVLRTFRLGEPTEMHFDEVYHARTATEFLQKWRYGLDDDIYEWTHPHLAKYAMAGGIVAFAPQDVAATVDLGMPVRDAVIEPRRTDILDPGLRAGDRLWLATGAEVVGIDLELRRTVARFAVAGASAVAFDAGGPTLLVGTDAGDILTLELTELDVLRDVPPDELPTQPLALTTLDAPIRRIVAADGGTTVAALTDDDRVVFVDLATGAASGETILDGAADLVAAGRASAVVADTALDLDPAAVADTVAAILGADAAELEQRLAGADGGTVILATGITDEQRTALDTAIADGSLVGVDLRDVGRLAVPHAAGVTFLVGSGDEAAVVTLGGGGFGGALVTGIDDDPELYVTTLDPETRQPRIAVITLDETIDGTASTFAMPGPVTRVLYDPASELVHVLGETPDGRGTTVYVIQPHADAVFADHQLPFAASGIVLDTAPDHPSRDRGELLAFSAEGMAATADIGHYPFAWRLPGVIAGVLTALGLYVLARVLFARRSVAVLTGLFVGLEGLLFVQSRIGMNDVYVGLFIVAAYAIFAMLWTGWIRARWAFWALLPVVGLLLGLALASKWVAAYAIGALGLLILARSALGRVLLVLGLIGLTTVLGWMAIAVGAEGGSGNLLYMLIMIGLTLLAAVVTVLRPIAWSDEEVRFAVGAPLAAGALVALGSIAAGIADTAVVVGPLALTPLHVAFALALGSAAVYGAFAIAGRSGFGPFAPAPDLDDPVTRLDPPAPAARGWLRLGSGLGLPVMWMLGSLVAIPLAVYVVSYIPWAFIGTHAIVAGWPAGHEGQTLLQLTGEMYRYHNELTAAHAASSPWWAWPLDLKPVWFYQGGYANETAAAIYGAGNLVIWWMGIPAMIFACIAAYRRRSLALALITIGFACQWIPWARIDRAAFQYHYYTSLPFVVLALAYLVAELWHGASARTWQWARIAAGLAVLGSPILWLLRLPACALVRVEEVAPGSQACVGSPGTLEITVAALALTVVGLGTAALIIRELVRLARRDTAQRPLAGRDLVPLVAVALVGGALMALTPMLPSDTPLITVPGLVPELIALGVAVPLGLVAVQVVTARDPRRFVAGFVVAAAAWFVVLYPNISALQLPTRLVNAYQGILPTYLYPFQFPVSTVDRAGGISFSDPRLLILGAAIVLATLIVGYAAWAWRTALAERAIEERDGGTGPGDAGFAPGGG